MKRFRVPLLVVAGSLAILAPNNLAQADDNDERSVRARLQGFEEVPALFTTGRGLLRATLNFDESFFEYELRFEDLVGTVTQAHIHFAQKGVNGGIVVWLCGTATNPGPAGTPLCGGPSSGIVSGTIDAADVVGPAGQGISAGEFQELLRAMRTGVTYANIHSTVYPGGEIRGQIRVRDGDDD